MTFDQMQYFAAVVEKGSISTAARRLHMSQPPLSLQIRNLESEYGVQLFERGARQIRLTEAGRLLYRHAVHSVELRALLDEDMRNLRSGRKGSVRIGIVSSGECQELMDCIAEYHRLNPDVSFQVFDSNTYTLLEYLENQKIDLAVIRTPFPDRALDSVTLRRDGIMVVGSPERTHMLPDGSLSPKDLQDHPLILYRRWEKILRECFDEAQITPNVFCANDDARTCVRWAEADLGIALVPASILHAAYHLESRPFLAERLTSEIRLVRQSHIPIAGSANAFFNLCKQKRVSSADGLPKNHSK